LLFATRPGGVLFVDGAPDLDFADVAHVIDIARGAGVFRIGLITDRERL
jgi:biopolymer transport protein ExbD